MELNILISSQYRDAWLDSIDEVEDPRTKLAKRPAKDDLEYGSDEEIKPLEPKEKYHLTKELYNLLTPGNLNEKFSIFLYITGESPNQALSRLRPAQAKPQKKSQKNVRKKQLKTEDNSEQHNLVEKGTEGTIAENKEEANGDEEKKKAFDRLVEICDVLCGNGYMEVYNDTRERIQNRFMRLEDEFIKHDLEDEGKIEDMNPDHNVVEQ